MPNTSQIPAPRVPFLDERTGLMAREWYMWFINLYQLTGGGEDSTTASSMYTAVMQGVASYGEDQSATDSVVQPLVQIDLFPDVVQPLATDVTKVIVDAGTALAPSVTTKGDLDTGIYFPATGQVAVASNGLKFFQVDDVNGVSVDSVVGATMLRIISPLTNGAGALTATLTNSPKTGNPTKWVGINDAGTIRYIPTW